MSAPASKPSKVLSKMLDRLFAGLTSGPGMNCRPHNSRQRVDLTQLGRLNDVLPDQILRQLLGPDHAATIVARVKPPKNSDAPQADATGDQTRSPEQRAWEEQMAMLNKIRVLADDARTYEQDTGVHVLNVGFPLLSLPPGTFSAGPRSGGKRILAPIAFIPVTLTLKRGAIPTIELACRGEGVDLILPNTALLAWLEQQTGKPQNPDGENEHTGEDPWREVCDLVANVATALSLPAPEAFKVSPVTPARSGRPEGAPEHQSESVSKEPAAEPPGSVPGARGAVLTDRKAPLPIPESFALSPAPRADADEQSPAILSGAVLGLFPMANQGLLRDTQAMLAQSADPSAPPLTGPVESFLTAGIDFDEAPGAPVPAAPSAPPQPSQRITKLFVSERLGAAADPCQARAVKLARSSRGLVVHGPPGTGKSQTITNVITDHLSRGQRVLLVCEKRTALDVVADRLEHMGLGQLCGIVHDPQRDQRDLYRAIRQQLEDLPEAKLHPTAEAKLVNVDSELQKLHEELTSYHHALMTPPAPGETSFHELMGQWMASDADAAVRINEAAAHAIAPAALDAAEPALLEVLGRAQQIDLARNPWAKCAGVTLGDFLSRPMDAVRTALDRGLAAAVATDATIDPSIPPFSSTTPLTLQGQARAELAERLGALSQQVSAAAVARWIDRDAQSLRVAQQRLLANDAEVRTFRAAPLDAGLRALADPFAQSPLIPQQLRDLDAYLQVAGKWYAFLSLGAKAPAERLLKQYGLPLTVTEAERVKQFLIGLRARLIVHQLRTEFANSIPPLPPGEGTRTLPPDDVLDRFVSNHAELLDLLLRLREDPALDALAPLAAKALSDRAATEAFLDGLRKSAPRAEALSRLEDELTAAVLFDPAWLAGFGKKLREGQPAAATLTALIDRLDTLEGVVRVRQARGALPKAVGAAADEILAQTAQPAAALATLRRAVLAGEITRRLRGDPQLQGVDAHRIESNFARYRELETQKKRLVCDAVRHRWVSRQKERLLNANATKMNSLGAATARRFLMSGPRSMRLRQVIALGEKNEEGGDPLFDLCPIWMASPETVAQIFPRKAVFDVVVFDEASQCRLEEALPVLTRGQRVLIAGDPQQLPPTRFFESTFTQSEDDEEPQDEQALFENQQAEVEDLLGAALNLSIDQCYLDVHYRSRNADLIGFSNVHFYNSRLQAIPGHPRTRSKSSPVTLYRVDGTYSDRQNEAEADRVVQIVRDLLKRGEPPSIGIACFNLQQRDLIVEKLDDQAAEDAAFAKRLATARARRGTGSFDGLFVKNLENVQGDERDHIIISTTYGPDARGKFYRRFGPLGRVGGGRRLNVLVTRARQEVHLVTSIPPDAYRNLPPIPEGQTAGGGWLLFAYLKYTEDLATTYSSTASAPPLAASQAENAEPTHLQATNRVEVRPTKTPSLFSVELARSLEDQQHIGSDVHWGNEGFCVDIALHHPQRPGDVTVGVLCDSCRYAAADDPVEWDIFRTGMLAGQGWQLRRVWTPHFFRDPGGTAGAIAKDVVGFVAGEGAARAVE